MSQAEELLNSVSEGGRVHVHPVPDTDTYFIIDPITRTIENTNRKKTVVMQYDHDSERFTFEIPRYVDGHDMLECTSITVNVDNIEAETGTTNSDAPDMTDLRLHPDDPEKVISSWLISRNSTQLAGNLSFSIEYKCVDDNGNVVYEWSTDTFEGIEVKARKKNGEAAVIEHTDLLEQWRTRIFGAGDSVMANIVAEGEVQVAAVKEESATQQEAVELKGATTLESIPEDYTKVDAMANEAVRSKGDAIICEAEGESIVLTDASDDHIRGLKLFGKTTQVTTAGHQLFDASVLPTTVSGDVTVTNNGDGSFSISGAETLTGVCSKVKAYTHEETIAILKRPGTYYFKCDSITMPYFYVALWRDGSSFNEIHNWNNTKSSFVVSEEMINDDTFIMRIGFYGTMGKPITATTVRPILYIDGDGTYEPYSGGIPAPNPEYSQELVSIENPLIGLYGKNLIDVDAMVLSGNKSLNVSGDKYTVTAVGGSNATYAHSYYILPERIVRLLRGQKVRLSSDSITKSLIDAYSPVQLNVKCADGVTLYPTNYDNKLYHEFTIPENAVEIRFAIYTNNSPTLLESDNTVVVTGVRLTLADNIEYAAHKPLQTAEIPRTLPGIPVTTGGNYTDENGQQWICDEIDFERGVYVQRVKTISISENEVTHYSQQYCRAGILIDDAKRNVKYTDCMAKMNRFAYDATVYSDVATNVGFTQQGNQFYVRLGTDTTVTDAPSFLAWLSENPVEVLYILESPIETPLTAEEITAFKALRTNYPNTTILNDAGAWMSVKYNADTKTYIENPKVLKLVDSSTGVVYELKIVDGNLTVVPV